MKRISIFVALLAFIATGCRSEVQLLLDVAEDGSGTIAAEVGINQQLRDLIDQLAGDSDNIISGLDLGLVGESGTRVDGDMTVYTTVAAFDNVSAVPEAAAGNFTSFNLELSDDGASLEATLDLAGELDLAEFPVDPGTIDSETLKAQIVVSLPGEVSDHNADEVTADGQFVWNIPLDGELYVFANTLYPKAGFPWSLVGLLVLSLGLAGGVWLAAVRRESKGRNQLPPAPTPPPLQTGTDGGLDAQPAEQPTSGASPFFELDTDS